MVKLEEPQKRKMQDWKQEEPRWAPMQSPRRETGTLGSPSAGKPNEASRKRRRWKHTSSILIGKYLKVVERHSEPGLGSGRIRFKTQFYHLLIHSRTILISLSLNFCKMGTIKPALSPKELVGGSNDIMNVKFLLKFKYCASVNHYDHS